MKAIAFTQYLMPHGTKKRVEIDRPDEVAEMAERLAAAGVHLEIEILSDYQTISMTAERGEDGEDTLAHEICPNGPEVPERVDKLIREALEALKQ